jgi:transglutaminase-like putative cysteine protease
MKILRQAAFGVVAATLLTVGTSLTAGVPIAQAAQYPMSQKQIIFGSKVVSQPMGIAAIDPASKKYTTYVPIYYVMQALKAVGIQSGWDGTNWRMAMPANLSPAVDLGTVRAGSGAKRIYINNVDVQNVDGIVYPDPASHVNTTYIPIWYVMKALGYENIQSGWDGTKWSMTPTLVSGTPSTPTTASSGAGVDSGVSPGVGNSGDASESWQNNGKDVTLNDLSFQSSTNHLPIQGTVSGGSGADILVEVYNSDSNNWFYSIPVDNYGRFSATIELPYGGSDSVSVGIPQMTNSFGLGDTSAYFNVDNSQPTLSDQQLSLLQSWMVNFNESGDVQSLGKQIAAGQANQDGVIKAVSDWVSYHTEYNFPEVNANKIAWQQASKTLQTKIGVCQDQAALAASLLRSLGIPTRVVGGEAYDTAHSNEDIGPHAWNMAWDGSRWVTFDSTWDQVYTQDQTVSPPDSVDDTYFDPPQQTFDQSHKPDSTQMFGWSANR